MKKIIPVLIMLLFILPLQSQEQENESEQTYQNVYTETILEDFETNEYTDNNVRFIKTRDQAAGAQVRDQFPAPFNNSKKYLGIKVNGKSGDTFQIFPAKPIEIKKYAQSISVWVYGKNFAGDLTLIIQDAADKTHRLAMGKTNFLGWKKITVNLPGGVKQQDDYLEQEKSLRILHIQYKPGNRTIHPLWQYFYIDDITATVRDKYKDSQSDDW